MKTASKILRYEFEARIFVSLSIVALSCIISAIFYRQSSPIYVTIFRMFDLEKYSQLMFLFASALMLMTTVLRMWSGSLLSSQTVMSFKVRSESLIISGPYLLVRNPIYFADLASLIAFSIFLPLPGIFIPILFYIHYLRLIRYEEIAFCSIHPASYENYLKEVPKLIPTPSSFAGFLKSKPKVFLSKDGIRHNALYSLFVPGFVIGYFNESFLTVAIIGIAGVIDWAIVHTVIGLPKTSPKEKRNKVFESVLYSQCWEDPQIDREAFRIQKDDVVFSITSGGCNLLSFLIDDPKAVIALDLNPHQNHLLELKMAAFRLLTYDNVLEFLGVRKCDVRLKFYELLRIVLSKSAREYWDSKLIDIKRGVIHCGRYEDYMKLLRKCLRVIVSQETISAFFDIEDCDNRKLLFEKRWKNWKWKLFTKVLLSRKTMSLLFDEAFFKYLKSDFSFGEHFASKVERALTELPIIENYFLRYILIGNYDEAHLPPYLCKENFEVIRNRLNRITIVTDTCENYFRQLQEKSISKFNFTNVFEWMSEDAFTDLLKETVRVAKNNSVITYRNLLVPRKHPKSLSNDIYSESELALRLHNKDLSFIYDSYIVEKIEKQKMPCAIKLSKYQPEMS